MARPKKGGWYFGKPHRNDYTLGLVFFLPRKSLHLFNPHWMTGPGVSLYFKN